MSSHILICVGCPQSYFSIYGPSYVEWLADLSCNVCFEDKFTASRALHNLSQEIPSPPPADDIQNETEINYTPPDFGNMGWRFCLDPIRKVCSCRSWIDWLWARRKLQRVVRLRKYFLILFCLFLNTGCERSLWQNEHHGSDIDAACFVNRYTRRTSQYVARSTRWLLFDSCTRT